MDNNSNYTSTSDNNFLNHTTENSKTQTTDTSSMQKDKKPDILIIEDNAIATRTLSLQLNTLCHCNIECAEDLGLALTHLNTPYNIIFTDFNFPDGTALPFVRQYHQLHPSVPIITVTAYITPTDREQLLKHGAQDIFIKPMSMDVLKKLLGTYI